MIDWIPLKFPKDQPANVSLYFNSRVKDDDSEKLSGFIRGRKLCGRYLNLPFNYKTKIVSIEHDEIKEICEIEKHRVWDYEHASLNQFLSFSDAIEIGKLLNT